MNVKYYKRSIALAFVALALTFGVSACGAQSEPAAETLETQFASLLRNIQEDAALFHAPAFELEAVLIGNAHQTYVLDEGQLRENAVQLYPFLYEGAVVAVATVGWNADGTVAACSADTQLSSVFQDAYEQSEAFALVYEHGALFYVTPSGYRQLQHGYAVPAGTEYHINDIDWSAADSAIFQKPAFSGRRLPAAAP